jgi:hypothetical protein
VPIARSIPGFYHALPSAWKRSRTLLVDFCESLDTAILARGSLEKALE